MLGSVASRQSAYPWFHQTRNRLCSVEIALAVNCTLGGDPVGFSAACLRESIDREEGENERQ